MKDLNIGKKLTIGFAGMMLIVAIVLAVAVINIKQVENAFDQVIKNEVQRVEMTHRIIDTANDIYTATAVKVMTDDKAIFEENTKIIADKRAELTKHMEALGKLEQTGEGKELFNHYTDVLAKGKQTNNQVMQLADSGNREQAAKIYTSQGVPTVRQNLGILQKLIAYQQERMNASRDAAVKVADFYLIFWAWQLSRAVWQRFSS